LNKPAILFVTIAHAIATRRSRGNCSNTVHCSSHTPHIPRRFSSA
jgi:hypothetical protein